MDILRELEFSQEWIDLGIVAEPRLSEIEAEWLDSEDRNPEHYRWRTFLEFSRSQPSLDPTTVKRLYDLGAKDPDSAMGGSIMAHVLRRNDCPGDLLRLAAQSDEKFLQKIAKEGLAKVVG